MQLPGLQALGLTPQSFQFAGLNGNNPAGNPFGPQGPQVSGTPSPTSPSPLAGANLGGLPPAMGSGQSNFAGFDSTNAFNTIGASPLTPSHSPFQRGLSAQAGLPGGKFNCIG
jgi:hypothetical protein